MPRSDDDDDAKQNGFFCYGSSWDGTTEQSFSTRRHSQLRTWAQRESPRSISWDSTPRRLLVGFIAMRRSVAPLKRRLWRVFTKPRLNSAVAVCFRSSKRNGVLPLHILLNLSDPVIFAYTLQWKWGCFQHPKPVLNWSGMQLWMTTLIISVLFC